MAGLTKARTLAGIFLTTPMTDILTWAAFALQVWSMYWPRPIGQARRNMQRARVTVWDLRFYKRTTLERVRHDTRT